MSRRNRKDVDDLLADLDNLGTEQPTKPSRKSADKGASSTAGSNDAASSGAKKAPEDAQSLLDDLDSLVQIRAASSSRASQRKKDDAVTASTPATASATPAQAQTPTTTTTEPAAAPAMTAEKSELETTYVPASGSSGAAGGGWAGWGSSLFSQATKLAEQARQELEKRAPTQAEQARELGSKVGKQGWDLAKGVRGFVKDAGLEKWGKSPIPTYATHNSRSQSLTRCSVLMFCSYRRRGDKSRQARLDRHRQRRCTSHRRS